MLLDIWSQPTGYNLGAINERSDVSIPLPLKAGSWSTTAFMVISGLLPPGLRINNNSISGYAFSVPHVTSYEFVIRATNNNGFADITLSLTVNGPAIPQWLTLPGALPVNPNGLYYVLDNTPVAFQLEASDSDTVAGIVLHYRLKSGYGELPDGLVLSDTGLIHGIVAPIPSLEPVKIYGFDTDNWDATPYDYGNGYTSAFDDYGYDNTIYDYSNTGVVPKKLNRNYQFTVSVSDGIVSIDRTFIIYVVTDEFLRSDNTFMQVGDGAFTADGTYLRAPYWLTDSNLGVKRANNYTMYLIKTLDPNPSIGPVVYNLEPFNLDNSLSRLPSGLDIDEINCVLFGFSPYQPPVTLSYTFTLSATKYDTGKINVVEVVVITHGVAHRGQTSLQVYPLTSSDVSLLLNQSITINDVFYTVTEYAYSPGSPYGILIISAPLLTELPDKTKLPRYFYIPTDVGTTVTMSTQGNNAQGSNTLIVNPVSTYELDLIVDRVLTIDNKPYKILDYTVYPTNTELLITPPLATAVGNNTSLSLTFRTDTVTSYSTFTLSLIGEIDSDLHWITASNLGTLPVGYSSLLSIVATSTVSNVPLTYTKVSGTLPTGIYLDKSGLIIGKALQYGIGGLLYIDGGYTTFDGGNTTFDRSHSFEVSVSDGYSTITKSFILTVGDPDLVSYTNITIKPYQPIELRQKFAEFINDVSIFEEDKIFRLPDPAFGIQPNLDMLFYAGIEKGPASSYIDALRNDRIAIKYSNLVGSLFDNQVYIGSKSGASGRLMDNDMFNEIVYFKMLTPHSFLPDELLTSNTNSIKSVTIWKESNRFRYSLGTPKLAVARNQGSDSIIYEVVYVDVFDRYELSTTSVDSSVKSKNGLKYLPNSTTNLRNYFAQLDLITENAFLPLWMQTPQSHTSPATGFIKAIPLCYCLPGQGSYILSNITHSGFDFSLIDYDIDRYVIDSVTDYDTPLYLKLV